MGREHQDKATEHVNVVDDGVSVRKAKGSLTHGSCTEENDRDIHATDRR